MGGSRKRSICLGWQFAKQYSIKRGYRASPVRDKRVFLVEDYPKKCDMLPDSLPEVQHRARDIMLSDKTLHNFKLSKAITYYLQLINDLYKMLEDHFDSNEKEDKEKFEKISARYKKSLRRTWGRNKGCILYYQKRTIPISL
jgi:hypothetical protein